MNTPEIVHLESVDIAYRGSGKVLSIESLRIRAGETIAVIGPSGGGKTSLLRAIKGNVVPVRGRAEVLGKDLRIARGAARRAISREIAFIPQQFHLVPRLHALANALCGRLGRTSRWRSVLGIFSDADKRAAWNGLAEVGLAEKAFRRAGTMSGGEQQRVAIARAIAQEPRLILADEPVASLDPKWAEEVLELLKEVQKSHNATLITTLHQPELARRFAQRIIGIRAGKIAFDLPAADVTDEVLADLYGEEISAAPRSETTAPAPRTDTIPRPDPSRASRWVTTFVLVAALTGALAWSINGTTDGAGNLADSAPRIVEFLDRMWPPDLSLEPTDARPFPPPLQLAGKAIAVTLKISILGTAIGAAIAFFLGLLGANILVPAWIYQPIRATLALVRSLPIILLALVFVSALGLGPLPGVLAVAVHSIGMLGKLYAEEFEATDPRVWESVDNTGASWLQKIRYALLPQSMRQIASHTLLRFEMNLRESAVLGLVGVGGLGLWIENYRRAFDYPSVATMVLLTVMLVLAVDQLTLAIRKKLL